MTTIDLDDLDVAGIDDVPVTESVRLHGPPGTGKTTQSAARVGKLLRDHDYEVSDVAWATYRRSLAEDTLERLAAWDLLDEDELDDPSEGATRYIGTTHAIANRIATSLPDPADRSDRIDFCDARGLQYTSPRPWDDGAGEMLFDAFAWLKQNRLDPADPSHARMWPGYTDLRETWDGDLPGVWLDWQDYKAQRELIDFYEMLERPLEKGLAPSCPVLVVDEYHDATPLMAELSEMWMDAADIVIVAGDPHQVVNSYDGADPEFFERLDLPKVLLDHTYRVPENLWRLGASMLSFAHSPPPVDREAGGYIDEYRSPTFRYDHSSGWDVPDPQAVAGPVWLTDEYDGRTLFLSRTKMQAAGVGRALDKIGVIYGSQKGIGGWHEGSDRLQLHNALQTIAQIEPGDFQQSGGVTSYGTSQHNPNRVYLSPGEATTLLKYTNHEYLARTRDEIEEACVDIRTVDDDVSLAELNSLVDDEFWQTHTAGRSAVERMNTGSFADHERLSLKAALERYDGPVAPDEQQAEVMTIHASKGKGAENVVLYDGTSPRAAKELERSESTRKNEYRTWYVGLTRASKRVCVMRSAFDWTVPILPSDLAAVVSSTDRPQADGTTAPANDDERRRTATNGGEHA